VGYCKVGSKKSRKAWVIMVIKYLIKSDVKTRPYILRPVINQARAVGGRRRPVRTRLTTSSRPRSEITGLQYTSILAVFPFIESEIEKSQFAYEVFEIIQGYHF